MSQIPERLIAALADRYRIEGELGTGGMATVYRALDLRHDRDVAIKVLNPELSASLGAERFLSEIRVTAKLQHPHIVPVFDSGDAGGHLFFVMPRIEGETLRARIERGGPLPVAEALRYVREVAGALAYAHERGILHRDLKPENILLSGEHALLADFGIAASTGAPIAQRLTQTGVAVGTPVYMSPEQATGERTLGPSSDIYALGAICFELLTGTPPFTGATYEAILVQRFTQDAPRVSSRRADTPARCDAAIAKALARDPAERFATASAFAEALGDVSAVPAARGPSLAVLPFANLSADADNGYFADGLTEEVILMLSKVSALRVRSRTSVAQYRERTGPPADIARALGVTHLLEGSVRKAGARIRIAVSLLEAERDHTLWSERFDGTLDDVFDMQDRVAQAIVDALRLRLTADEQAALLEHPILSGAAYDEYLRAREGLEAFNVSGFQRAMSHLAEASRLEPQNVFVLRGLGRACWAAVNHGVSGDVTYLDKALGYAAAIERIAPTSPYVNEIRGLVAAARGDTDGALRGLAAAYDAMPTDEDVGVWYAIILLFSGRVEPAQVLADAVTRAHGNGYAELCLRAVHVFRAEPERLRSEFGARLGNVPELPYLLFQIMAGYALGDAEHVRRVFERVRVLPADPLVEMARFQVAAISGDAAAAQSALTPAVAAVLWNDWQYTELVAAGFAALGDEQNVVKWLSRSVELGNAYVATTAHAHAYWRAWREHGSVAPAFKAAQAHAERYAAIPLAARLSEMMAAR